VIVDGHKAALKSIGGNPVYLDPTASQLYGLLATEQDVEATLLSFSNQEVEGIGAEIEDRCNHELYLSHFQISL